MGKIQLILISCLFISACGGGSGGDNEGSNFVPQQNSSIEHSKHLGQWRSNCVTADNGTSGDAVLIFSVDTGVDLIAFARGNFATSDCSGTATSVLSIAGSPFYSGKTTTSNCIADNIDIKVEVATEDGTNIITGNALSTLLQQNDIPETIYDIVCQFSDRLFLGEQTETLDSSSSTRRPIVEDVSLVFTRISAKAAEESNYGSLNALIKAISK